MSGGPGALPGADPLLARTDKAKPQLNLLALGPLGHGKSTLALALSRVREERPPERGRLDAPARAPQGLADEAAWRRPSVGVVECESEARRYALFDWLGPAVPARVGAGSTPWDGALLVLAGEDGLSPELGVQVRLARLVGVPALVVFLNKLDVAAKPGALDALERGAREFLAGCGFPGDDTPVVRGSALSALLGGPAELGGGALSRLLAALDGYLPQRAPAVERDFLLSIEDTFPLTGRGTVAMGQIERGRVKTGDPVEIVGLGARKKTAVTGLSILAESPRDPDRRPVGCLLRGVARQEVRRGQVLTRPGSIRAHSRFSAEIYLLPAGFGGRAAPIAAGYSPQLYLRTLEVDSLLGPLSRPAIAPGEGGAVEVEIAAPLAVERGTRFSIREDGGRVVGFGVARAPLP